MLINDGSLFNLTSYPKDINYATAIDQAGSLPGSLPVQIPTIEDSVDSLVCTVNHPQPHPIS